MNIDTLFSSKEKTWETPQELFDELNKEFHFTLDPCASSENAKCSKYFSKEEDGLQKNWGGVQRVLQSALWQKNWKMDTKSISGKSKTKYTCCLSYSGQN